VKIENWPDVKARSYDARYIYYHSGKTYNLMQRGSKRSSRCRREKPLAKVLFSSKSVIKVLGGEVENVFLDILLCTLDLRPRVEDQGL